MSTARIIREKETFRTESIVNIDGEDVRFFVKSSVNYERLTYKVSPIITLIHGESREIDNAIIQAVHACRFECKRRLETYREESGIGTQGDLFQGEPHGAN